MLVYSSGSLETVGYTDLYSNETLILENLYLNMFLLLMVEPFVGEVSNKLVWLTLLLRLNVWLHLKPQRKLYGLKIPYESLSDTRWRSAHYSLLWQQWGRSTVQRTKVSQEIETYRNEVPFDQRYYSKGKHNNFQDSIIGKPSKPIYKEFSECVFERHFSSMGLRRILDLL